LFIPLPKTLDWIVTTQNSSFAKDISHVGVFEPDESLKFLSNIFPSSSSKTLNSLAEHLKHSSSSLALASEYIQEYPGMKISDYVAEIDKEVMDYSSFGPSRYEQFGAGEIYAFYVLKSYQRQGIGKLLMEESLKKLSQANHLPAIVLTLRGNTSAEEFYEKRGFQGCGKTINQIDGRDYEEVVYRFNSL
jgi:ribosomal protein S18 acetylase RimI-like enzyme